MFPWNLFPFGKEQNDMKKWMQQMNPQEIEKYVQSMMGNMFSDQMKGTMNPQDFMKGFGQHSKNSPNHSITPLHSEVFETHDFVFVRVSVKEDEWLKRLKLYHTSNQLIIEHIPAMEDKHTITLPAVVKKKGSTAYCKDGTLEVKIPKNIDMQFSEIDVTEIY
ncbi:Hsp20/alpha crystallin family protein [Cytobacillus sp. FJAT-54145]|uniref:Hsp20/alpha crystallin family protein n=1 Tax=Cytobacillus spartinae TaxID=3299023 RepID=A0ABW6KEA3_9BACI